MSERTTKEEVEVLKERIRHLEDSADRAVKHSDDNDELTREQIRVKYDEARYLSQRVKELEGTVSYHRRIVGTVRMFLYLLAAVLTLRIGTAMEIIEVIKDIWS